jgi:hypothetical protein
MSTVRVTMLAPVDSGGNKRDVIGHEDSVGLSVSKVYISATR